MEINMLVQIGKGIELDAPDFSSFSKDVQDHIVYTGLRNLLQDAHASMTAEKANGGDVTALSREMAERKLAALVRGDLRVATTREGDPVKAEAMRLALNGLKKKAREEGKKIDEREIKARAREFLSTPSPALDKLLAKAKRNVKEAADIDIEV
jgi:hypothetical protein